MAVPLVPCSFLSVHPAVLHDAEFARTAYAEAQATGCAKSCVVKHPLSALVALLNAWRIWDVPTQAIGSRHPTRLAGSGARHR